jgi:hypothetical protein
MLAIGPVALPKSPLGQYPMRKRLLRCGNFIRRFHPPSISLESALEFTRKPANSRVVPCVEFSHQPAQHRFFFTRQSRSLSKETSRSLRDPNTVRDQVTTEFLRL